MNRLLVVSIVLVGMLAVCFFGLSGVVMPAEKCTPQWTIKDESKIPLIHKEKDNIRFKRCGIFWASDRVEEIFSIELGPRRLFYIRNQISKKVGSFVGIMYARMDKEWYEIKFKMPTHRGQSIEERIEYRKKVTVDQLPVSSTHEFIDKISSYFVSTISGTEIINIYIKNHIPYCEAIKIWEKIIAVKEGV